MELSYGERSNLRKLRVFGCIAYLHIPKELIDGKFESRSKCCRLIGYCSNGYRLWSPEDQKVPLGRNVIFDESKFNFDSGDFYVDTTNACKEVPEDAREVDEVSEFSDEASEHSDSATEEGYTEVQSKNKNEGLRRSTRERRKPEYLQNHTVLALSA